MVADWAIVSSGNGSIYEITYVKGFYIGLTGRGVTEC